jgi:hypothetical protein
MRADFEVRRPSSRRDEKQEQEANRKGQHERTLEAERSSAGAAPRPDNEFGRAGPAAVEARIIASI